MEEEYETREAIWLPEWDEPSGKPDTQKRNKKKKKKKKKKSPSEEVRRTRVGRGEGAQGANTVRTSKYSALSFVPLLLAQLFAKKAYLYFLLIAVLVFVPAVSPVQPYGPVAALAFLVAVSAVREAVEDVRRHAEDRRVNQSRATVRRGGRWQTAAWQDLAVGDLVRMANEEAFPADLVLAATDDPNGIAWVETRGLDGESNAKPKNAALVGVSLDDAVRELTEKEGAVLESEAPNKDLTSFDGALTVGGRRVPLNNHSVLYRGSRLINTSSALGIVVFTGGDTKILRNYNVGIRFKVTSLERRLDRYVVVVFIILFALCFSAGVAAGVLESQYWSTATYLMYEADSLSFATTGVVNFFTYFILLSGLVPLPLYVSLELIKIMQAVFISWDLDMCEGEEHCKAKSALSDELGRIEYIFSDKTGTLTCNEMILRRVFAAPGHEEANVYLAAALCHTVLTEKVGTEEGNASSVPGYNAENPDERALVEGSAAAGFVFQGRDSGDMLVNGKRYELLHEIGFSSERKRMSVIVRMPDTGNIVVVCKGAESVLFNLLADTEDASAVDKQVTAFSRLGLRTLVFAQRVVAPQEYALWHDRYSRAMSAMHDRSAQLEQCAAEMERDFELLGTTGVEDLLQQGVPDCIALLRRAGIRIWMITGDKMDTAVNIAQSCQLLNADDTQSVLNGETRAQVIEQLVHASQESCSGLVITGNALEYCVEPTCADAFLRVCLTARSVVCCRVSPRLKGAVVALVRAKLNVITLAIGDGANDVQMIREADVGIGIFGKEGRSAVMAADYGVASFSFLSTLLLVHGSENYRRVVLLILYTLYKGLSFGLVQFWLSLFTLFSGQSIWESWTLGLYHLLFTSLPVIVCSVSDRPMNRQQVLRFPELYNNGEYDFTLSSFSYWVVRGIVDSVVIFFVCVYATFGEGAIGASQGWCYGLYSAGIACYTSLVILVNIKLAVQVNWWTWPLAAVFVFSILLWFAFAALLSSVFQMEDASMYGVTLNVLNVPAFWMAVLLTVVLTILPELLVASVRLWVLVADWDIARRIQ